MCGIAGFLGRFSESLLPQMGDRIAHRGPDDSGVFHDPEARIGLVHRRLSIIDLSPAGHQPMVDTSGRFTLVYNGEIYNFAELRRELQASGATFRGHSDTEVVLELIARRGLEALDRLNGIFALALWDRRERRLHLARDGMGVKPLYWTRTPSGFAFASEMKALLALPDLSRTLDPVAATAYVSYLYSPGTRTMLADVRKLAPGQRLTLALDREPLETPFWKLPAPSPKSMPDSDWIAEMRTQLEAAVERQMVSDVQIGAFLSGGLDSSSIVALARRHVTRAQLPCFTIDYASRPEDERELISDLPYARAAARHLDVDLHEVRVDASMADDFEKLVTMLDEPQADPAALNNYYIAELARQAGVKVMLSGAGGDDVFSGYRRHKAAGLDALFDNVPPPLRRAVAGTAGRLPLSHPTARRARKALEHLGDDHATRIARMFEWLPLEKSGALLADAPTDIAGLARDPFMETVRADGLETGLQKVLRLDQSYFLVDHNLNYTDKTGMAAGVEIRVPFLDLELVEWAAGVPDDLKLRRGETKWILRQAAEDLLPHDIIYRPKTGFGVPLRSWMRERMRPMMDELLAPKTIEARGLFSSKQVSALRAATDRGTVDGSYSLLGVAAIELWCRTFIDGR